LINLQEYDFGLYYTISPLLIKLHALLFTKIRSLGENMDDLLNSIY